MPRTVFKAIASGNTLTESAALATMNPATGQLNPTGITQALAYTYDAKNRLSRAQIGANAADFVTYKINAMGQRVQKTGAGLYAFNLSLTIDAATGLSPLARTVNFNARYVYDEQGRLIGEYAPDGKLISETVWFNDLPIATLRPKGANAGTPLGIAGTTTGNPSNGATAANANNVGNNSTTNRVNVEVFYVHADHLGTPRTVTRSTVATGANAPSSATSTSPGAINKAVWRWDSDPFGTSLDNSKPTENPQLISGTATVQQAGSFKQNHRFPGQLADGESAKYYNYFRDYDSSVGRYTESDPIGLDGGISTFGYVEMRPQDDSDSFGLKGRRPPKYKGGGNSRDRRQCRRHCPEKVEGPKQDMSDVYSTVGGMYSADPNDPWFACLEWSCDSELQVCSPWDRKKTPYDFLPAASDPNDAPDGCVCSKKVLIGSGPRPPKLNVYDPRDWPKDPKGRPWPFIPKKYVVQ